MTPTLKERLECLLSDDLPSWARRLSPDDARKLLALLKAAQDFHEAWNLSLDDNDSFYSTRDTLLNAIAAVEGKAAGGS